ncbi:uncharacterized protein LOC126916803 isoform X1 [Bombus affinis]|uniref:uncharacterized protein LOC126916803 isoform X1 n=2 Tax=Bombus affinis TaxID=309941 RepID=UPI0021B6FC20|nr:uncharacterized protein LOC126916803 isoform X1 [Bombus affinis]XP_050578933.1 uncharacterized protein LOC126916803 isoform X1 [Bombus affinis]
MDNRPVNLFLQKIEENARKVFSSLPEDNGGNRSRQRNCTLVKIKEEETGDEIQEYAATAMSELLGWYGYDKVDSGYTKSLNLDHFTSISDAKNQALQTDQDIVSNKLRLKSPVVNTSDSIFEVSNVPLSYSNNNLMSVNRQLISSPLSLKPVSFGTTSKFPYESYSSSIYPDNVSCSWCGKIVQIFELERSNSFSYNMMDALGYFCSENCFAASRRAIFKQAKTCDWCRHIRNPISYVDLQDGKSQLQFCSNKCLNQYKMNIFCHETQTHLMLQGLNNVPFHDTEKSGLITPELWFRSCQSPLNSPAENTYLVDTHLTHSLSSPLCENRSIETEEIDNEKSVDPHKKWPGKINSVCTKKCTKSNNCNKHKKNFYTEINEHDKEQSLVNEKSKCCHSMINQTNCKENYLRKNDLNCKDFKQEYVMDTMNNSHSPKDSNTYLERNIHVKNIRNLQEKGYDTPTENILQSSSWFSNSTSPTMHHEIPSLSKSCINEPNQIRYQNQTNVFSRSSSVKQSNPTELFHSLPPTTLLPPVTVLVPYPLPIPIPIPIPIPVPISTAIFNKLVTDKEDSINMKDSNCKNVECKNSIENKYSVFDKPQIKTTNLSTAEDSQQVKLDKFSFSSSSLKTNTEINDTSHQLQQNKKLLRKRKRSNKIINHEHEKIQLKKRNNFIAT